VKFITIENLNKVKSNYLKIGVLLLSTILISCAGKKQESESSLPLIGTWKLISGTTIEKNDTTITDYTKGLSFIKIINDTHFAFLMHDLTKGKDSTAAFSAGGGRYELKDDKYKENLEYCSDRAWEGNDFDFIIKISNDTLIQRGIEKVESAGVNRINIEKYVRVQK
jgi:hypothetical protein